MRNNPNGANQYKADPRQSLFLANYLDPKSETFSNALRSALKAGYEQEYAEVITAQMPTWLSDALGERKLVEKAEINLGKYLDSNDERIGLDTTKFVLERLKKDKYSQRNEHTGKDGKDLIMTPEQAKEALKVIADEDN